MFPTLSKAQPLWLALSVLFVSAANAQTTVFINEIHYDNTGTDTGEFIEITGPVDADISGWTVVLYNGSSSTREPYGSAIPVPTLVDDGSGQGFSVINYPSNGIQNGGPDGIALVDGSNNVVQFLSYEGSFTAANGPAAGLTSQDIGVSETSSTAVGESLQLIGSGSGYEDFTWQMPAAESPGLANVGQEFVAATPDVAFISELHYDNTGADSGEAVEVTGTAGIDLSSWELIFYNGSNGTIYRSESLSGTLADQDGGFGTAVVPLPSNGIQNGAPDGIALVNDGQLVQFISYEGVFNGSTGPADGVDSIDIGVEENGGTPVGASLEVSGCDADGSNWVIAATNSFGSVNAGLAARASADCISLDLGGGEEPPTGGDAGLAFINELHYDNASTDVNEGFEIAAEEGVDLGGWSVVLYNGNGGGTYNTVALSGVAGNQGDGFDFISFPVSGIQNGAPDGLALVDPNGGVVQFLSYEGVITASNGPANGLTSEDIGRSENSSTPDNFSLQVFACEGSTFLWNPPGESTFGAVNTGQVTLSNVADCLPDSSGGEEPPTGPSVVTVPQIQGDGPATTIGSGPIRVSGIVTGDFPALPGFFLQDDGDGNPATSDGVFVFTGNISGADVSVGDIVTVDGTAGERFGQTQVTASSVTVTGTGAVPTPVLVSFPVSSLDDLEAVEGMLIQITQTMTVTELRNLDPFGELLLSAEGRQFQFSQLNVPDVTANQAFLDNQVRNRLILDDDADGSISGLPPYPAPGLSDDNVVRVGDTITGLTGNLGFGFGQYRLRPTTAVDIDNNNPRPAAPPEVGGRLKVVSFNVENFFNTLDQRGAETDEELSIQIDKLVAALSGLDADVYGLIELENDSSEGASSSIAELTAALNAANTTRCGMNYDYLAKTEADETEDLIAVGLIYCANTVAQAPGTELAVLNDTVVTELGLFTRPLFNDFRTNRTPIAATFEELATGEQFTVTVNHFKSKSPSGASGADQDQGDGAGAWNAIRTEASEALLAWLDTAPTGSDDPDVAILGDLNAYAFETPITTLEMAGFEDLGKREPFTYGFIFGGASGTLDYILTSPDLSTDVTGFGEWHINADESDAFEYAEDLANPALPFRIADHDPALVGIDLDDTIAPEIASCGTPDDSRIRPWNRGIQFQADVSDRQDANPAVEITDIRCKRVFRRFTWPFSFCRVSADGDTLTIRRPGGLKNRISWTVNATDAAGNTSSQACSVDVSLKRRRR